MNYMTQLSQILAPLRPTVSYLHREQPLKFALDTEVIMFLYRQSE